MVFCVNEKKAEEKDLINSIRSCILSIDKSEYEKFFILLVNRSNTIFNHINSMG